MHSLPPAMFLEPEPRLRPGIRLQHFMRQLVDIVPQQVDRRAEAVFPVMRRSIAFPPCSIVDPQNPGSPAGVFLCDRRFIRRHGNFAQVLLRMPKLPPSLAVAGETCRAAGEMDLRTP